MRTRTATVDLLAYDKYLGGGVLAAHHGLASDSACEASWSLSMCCVVCVWGGGVRGRVVAIGGVGVFSPMWFFGLQGTHGEGE
jgi:hypothetical protein